MPKVKKKARSKKTAPGILDRMRDLWVRFSRAVIAALVLIALLAGAMLWSSGHLGDQAARLASAAAIATGFEVTRITVKGLDEASESDLLNAVGPVIGTSLINFDPFAARARVENIGWVRSAAVTKLLPGTVHVSVREREPAAVWQMSGALHLIDPNGAIIEEIGAYEYANLPLIVGAGAPGAASGMLSQLRGEPDLWGRVSALIRVSDRRWNLRTKSGYDIKFPEHGYAQAVSFLAQLNAQTGILDEPLEYIDLRNPENFVYRLKEEDEKPVSDLN